jgi:ABC-type Fe3+/spermidine/putrescine transport system ATPase subunit
MNVTLRHLRKAFGAGRPVVDDVSFEIATGEIFGLVGPSGCGKTTLLRMLAGFVRPDAGDILFGERRVNDLPPQERNAAMVFQQYAIWPHLTVFDNIAYGPRARRLAPGAVEERVRRALAITRLDDLATRKPAQLSGGQQQRVALARALAVDPDLVLFDEPLSSLDARLRLELRDELRRIQRETRLTCLYVTHDQEEALALSDRLGVMNGGRLEQVGKPEDIYRRPTSEFVARFMGEINLLPPGSPWRAPLGIVDTGTVGFRPETARLGGAGARGTVRGCRFLGSKTELEVTTENSENTPPLKLWTVEPVEPGTVIHFQVEPVDLIRFPSKT